MKRQKTKWRFQNIATASCVFLLGGAWSAVPQEKPTIRVDLAGNAEAVENTVAGLLESGRPLGLIDTLWMDDLDAPGASGARPDEAKTQSEGGIAQPNPSQSPMLGPVKPREQEETAQQSTLIPWRPVEMAARPLSILPSAPPPVPSLKGSFRDFQLPNESRFWELHGLEMNSALKRAIARLGEHISGTSREKTSAFQFCDARRLTSARDPRLILTPDGISCLYYRWQTLLRERKAVVQKNVALKSQKKKHPGKKVSSKRGKKSAVATLAINSKKDFRSLAQYSYEQMLKKIEFKTEPAAMKAVGFALEESKDCSLTSVRAAVLRDLENLLPSDGIWRAMNQLYDATAACLDPKHEAFEVVNLRLALLNLDRGQLDRAASLLDVVLQGQALQDEHVALFWRGYLDSLQDQGKSLSGAVVSENKPAESSAVNSSSSKPRNTYWERLVDKYPLTLHALVVDEISGVDSFERYARRPSPQVSVYSGQEWNFENVSHLMAAIFMVHKGPAQMERISRLLDESGVQLSSFETAMFRVRIHDAGTHQRSMIKVISSSLKTFGSSYLCADLLELLYPVKFRNEIAQQASYIDPALVFSLIRQESSFNPKATSPVGAKGLMQVMPATAKKIEKRKNLDLYDPSTNIRVGSKYLHILRNHYNGDYPRLIASYNAGPNSVKKWDGRYRGRIPLLFADIIPFPETRHYVTGLMRHMYWYRSLVSHVKDTSGAVKIKWSWALVDVVPKAEQFGLKPGEVRQVKIEKLPWQDNASGKTNTASGK